MTPSARATLLIAEDDPAIRSTLADILELNGYEVLSAANGKDALEIARSRLPSLVLTDINMPLMNGYELLRELKASEELQAIPVIMVTAKVERSSVRQGMDLGAEDYITKPFTEHEVLRSVAARLERSRLIQELDAFSHTVAHDLKTPISIIRGRLELMEMFWDRDDDAAKRKHLAAMNDATQRMVKIIEELLLLAGVRKQSVKIESLDMGALVGETVRLMEDIIRQKEASVELAASWPTGFGYGPWISEVLTNYLSNALKYGGVPPRISIGGELREEGRRARFWVQDQGPGLDEKARDILFVPFTRISTVRATGHGLGLSIVRRIVEKLGGEVGVESEPGKGARFWFELPATQD